MYDYPIELVTIETKIIAQVPRMGPFDPRLVQRMGMQIIEDKVKEKEAIEKFPDTSLLAHAYQLIKHTPLEWIHFYPNSRKTRGWTYEFDTVSYLIEDRLKIAIKPLVAMDYSHGLAEFDGLEVEIRFNNNVQILQRFSAQWCKDQDLIKIENQE